MSHEDGLREHSRNIFFIFLYYVATTLLTCHLDDDGEHWHPFHREYTGIPALINAETGRQAGRKCSLALSPFIPAIHPAMPSRLCRAIYRVPIFYLYIPSSASASHSPVLLQTLDSILLLSR